MELPDFSHGEGVRLDNGNVLEVNGEQFSKAKVGEKCEIIIED